ncbi:hypothetical protein N7516_007354 [Penicillium verrucosum]|uniref:uncharacterized protein n=1 Tax=Penicillium verrucosum TaxID=60171 RepID=UPI002544E452|nr:uncharacterized protein N7516_007354 [Penicillium verrucosum]KAJ5932865.1 hypothetical protein N7516_007354 [Penicillium verrucosum]
MNNYLSGPEKGLHLSRKANNEDLPKARPLSWMEDLTLRRMQKAHMRNHDVDVRDAKSIAPFAANLDTLGLVQTESTQVIKIKEIRFKETCLDSAILHVELEKDGCRTLRWLEFGDFNTIRNADVLKIFKPSFPARNNVIKVCSVQYAESLLDITELYVERKVNMDLEICWLDYKDFERISGARKALTEFRGKSATSPFMERQEHADHYGPGT